MMYSICFEMLSELCVCSKQIHNTLFPCLFEVRTINSAMENMKGSPILFTARNNNSSALDPVLEYAVINTHPAPELLVDYIVVMLITSWCHTKHQHSICLNTNQLSEFWLYWLPIG